MCCLWDFSLSLIYFPRIRISNAVSAAAKTSKPPSNPQPRLRGDLDHGFYIDGAREYAIGSAQEATQMALQALHTYGQVKRQQQPRQQQRVAAVSTLVYVDVYQPATLKSQAYFSRMQFVDLAGQTLSKDNKDMLALGRLIMALSERPLPASTPYRDSKLTSLLHNAFGGNCCTVSSLSLS